MLKIIDKSECCGCSACVQVCPKKCVDFIADDTGFSYPNVNTDVCINCGLCEKVCPVINKSDVNKPLAVYASKCHDDNIRVQSSSGGIFTIIAKYIIDYGGVVFGARYTEEYDVEHCYVDKEEDLSFLRGSKYVQSNIGNTYIQAKEFLDSSRLVLYSGTACQIAGLKKFLRKDYNNLLTIDVVCHGVPSPLVWQLYLNKVTKSDLKRDGEFIIDGINLRSKSTGWRNYSCEIKLKSNQCTFSIEDKHDQNLYMRLFLSNLILRPSCFNCPAKAGRAYSDITLGDFWGVEHTEADFDDDKGVSVVLLNNVRAVDLFQELELCTRLI